MSAEARRTSPRLFRLGRKLPPEGFEDDLPDYEQAEPSWIRHALRRAEGLPSGGWYAIGASRAFGEQPRCVTVAGRALVVFRANGQLVAAPNACPHMGAPLAAGRVVAGRIVCPWHGLSLGPEGHERWQPLPSHDDGVLFWVRLPGDDEPTTLTPYLPERPSRYIDAVIEVEAACDPRDVLSNRLDPWHGVHLHPYAFGRLRVLTQTEDAITVRVAYRVLGAVAMEVDARFHCSDPRTIVMTIVRGDGLGSVVETHATPVAPGRTTIIEATLASSDRPGFGVAIRAARFLRPLIEGRARRLWVDDAAYAERLHALRRGVTGERGNVVTLTPPWRIR
jgi:hypothetical protein